jgi:hypothetical protein
LQGTTGKTSGSTTPDDYHLLTTPQEEDTNEFDAELALYVKETRIRAEDIKSRVQEQIRLRTAGKFSGQHGNSVFTQHSLAAEPYHDKSYSTLQVPLCFLRKDATVAKILAQLEAAKKKATASAAQAKVLSALSSIGPARMHSITPGLLVPTDALLSDPEIMTPTPGSHTSIFSIRLAPLCCLPGRPST